MSSRSDEMRVSKRFNLKLPSNVRKVFCEPFDAYLGYLLENTVGLPQISDYLERDLQIFSNLSAPSGSLRWTLWVSHDIRKLFDQQKSLLAPRRTHGKFVEFLLAYRGYLESIGTLPPFTPVKKMNPNFEVDYAYGLLPFQPIHPYQFSSQPMPNFGMKSNDMYVPSYESNMDYLHGSTASSSKYLNPAAQLESPYQENTQFASQDTLYPTNTISDFRNIPRTFLKFSRDQFSNNMDLNLSEYNGNESPIMLPSALTRQFTGCMTDPIDFPMQIEADLSLTSPDVIRASHIEKPSYFARQNTFVTNEMSRYFDFEQVDA